MQTRNDLMRYGPPHDERGTPTPAPDTIYPERDSAQWDQAWAALMATGRDPSDGWQLMNGERAPVPGGYRWSFKNHSLCETSMRNDPAYNGVTKYVYLPEGVASVREDC